MAHKTQMVEMIIKTADGANQATAIVAFECDDGTECKGSIVSIAAKTPSAEFGIAWYIGLGVSAEITMTAGSVSGHCVNGKCEFTITASWTLRAKLTIGIQWYDRSKTFIGTGTFTSICNCN